MSSVCLRNGDTSNMLPGYLVGLIYLVQIHFKGRKTEVQEATLNRRMSHVGTTHKSQQSSSHDTQMPPKSLDFWNCYLPETHLKREVIFKLTMHVSKKIRFLQWFLLFMVS